jgi:hypothetical protein
MSNDLYIVGVLCGLSILGMLIWIAVALHMAYTKIDSILDTLNNCPAVKDRIFLRDLGPWGHLILIGNISSYVTFPRVFIKHGSLSAEDLGRLPTSITKKLKFLQWSAIWLFSILVFFVIVTEFLR